MKCFLDQNQTDAQLIEGSSPMGVNLENDWTDSYQKIKYEEKFLLISESLMGGTGRLCQEMKQYACLCATP